MGLREDSQTEFVSESGDKQRYWQCYSKCVANEPI